jgi:putative aldouronate transport system substrate-binding protein
MKRRLLSVLLMACLACVAAFARGASESKTSADAAPVIRYWGLQADPQIVGDTANNPFCNEVRKATGLAIDFTFRPITNLQEQFNLLMVSGNLPDVIQWDWQNYPGGPSKAIKDSLILPLNGLIAKGHFPNMMAYMKSRPDVDKSIKIDDGTYYVAPMVRDGDFLLVYWGPVIRKEFLAKTGLAVPETMAEWEAMLKAFRDTLKLKAPLTLRTKGMIDSGYSFVGAYQTGRDFLVKDGRVVYGPLEPGFKEFLRLWSRWYAEKLIDPDVATADQKIANAKILSDEAGAIVTYTGSGMGAMMTTRKAADFTLIPARYPVLRKGDMPYFSQKTPPYTSVHSASISAQSKHPEEAARLLDFFFSEKGRMLKNFGLEGVTYNMVNGYPTYTQLITRDKTRTFTEMLDIYGKINGPGLNDVRYMEQYTEQPEQKEAITLWSISEVDRHMMPPISFTSEESSKVATIMNDVRTLVDEMYLKIFLGKEPVDKWDTALDQIRKIGIDRAVEIYNGAYARFQSR